MLRCPGIKSVDLNGFLHPRVRVGLTIWKACLCRNPAPEDDLEKITSDYCMLLHDTRHERWYQLRGKIVPHLSKRGEIESHVLQRPTLPCYQQLSWNYLYGGTADKYCQYGQGFTRIYDGKTP